MNETVAATPSRAEWFPIPAAYVSRSIYYCMACISTLSSSVAIIPRFLPSDITNRVHAATDVDACVTRTHKYIFREIIILGHPAATAATTAAATTEHMCVECVRYDCCYWMALNYDEMHFVVMLLMVRSCTSIRLFVCLCVAVATSAAAACLLARCSCSTINLIAFPIQIENWFGVLFFFFILCREQ